MNIRRSALAVILVLVIALVGLLIVGCQPAPTPQPQSVYGNAVYFPPGGNQLVVGSGGEIELQSGASLDIQAGATAALAGGFTPTTRLWCRRQRQWLQQRRRW